jgi:outer membrane protein
VAERARTVAAVACAALLAGCATVAEARRVQDLSSAVPGERTPTAAELGLPVKGPLALDRALAAALAAHPSVLRARREEQAAEARTGEAEGALLPSLAANGSAGYRNSKSSGLPSGREEHRFQSGGFQLSWLLFDFGRTPALARQAAAQWLAAQEEARGAEVDAAFGVRTAYFTLLKQFRLRDVARDAVKQFEEHLEQVKEFVRVGTRIPYDQTKAEVDLGNAKLDLVRTEDAVLAAQATLATALGLAEVAEWEPADAPDLDRTPQPFDVCWADAKRARPAIASAAARELAASELLNARIAELYPQLSLGLGFTASGPTTPLDWVWQAGASLAWVPFDGFSNLYSIDEAVANLRAARADRAAAEQVAWLDVRTAWLAVEDARRRLDVTVLLVRSAEENVTLAQGRFDVGRGTAIELTDAQQALIQARAEDVQARADVDLATARLARAIGISVAPGEKP